MVLFCQVKKRAGSALDRQYIYGKKTAWSYTEKKERTYKGPSRFYDCQKCVNFALPLPPCFAAFLFSVPQTRIYH